MVALFGPTEVKKLLPERPLFQGTESAPQPVLLASDSGLAGLKPSPAFSFSQVLCSGLVQDQLKVSEDRPRESSAAHARMSKLSSLARITEISAVHSSADR